MSHMFSGKMERRLPLVSSEFSRLILYKSLHVTHVTDTRDRLQQLLMVNDRLWGLTCHQGIDVFDPETGQQVDTLRPGFQGQAQDMTMSESGHVVIATVKGIVVVDTEGHVTHEVQGKYLAVTRSMSEEGCVWAVEQVCEKRTRNEVWLVKYRVSAAGVEQINRIKTHLKPDGYYMTELRGRLIISSYCGYCLYLFDTRSGSHISTSGLFGGRSPDEVYGPEGVYCDPESDSVLVMDVRKSRLQVLNFETDSWSVVKREGDIIWQPKAAAEDQNKNIWICGGLGVRHQLYKCHVVTE